jgi:hypothetical protein
LLSAREARSSNKAKSHKAASRLIKSHYLPDSSPQYHLAAMGSRVGDAMQISSDRELFGLEGTVNASTQTGCT